MKREVVPEAGWIPKAGTALGGGDPQEAGRGGLVGPVRKDKKTIDLVDTSPQALARKLHKRLLPAGAPRLAQ